MPEWSCLLRKVPEGTGGERIRATSAVNLNCIAPLMTNQAFSHLAARGICGAGTRSVQHEHFGQVCTTLSGFTTLLRVQHSAYRKLNRSRRASSFALYQR